MDLMMTDAASPTPWWKRYGLVLGVYVVLMAILRPFYVGDSIEVYVREAILYARGEISNARLLDFGHILVRPIGFAFFRWGWPLKPDWIDLNETLFVASGLIAVSLLAGAVFAVLMQAIASKISGSEAVGRGVSITLLVSNAFLNYAQTGNTYIPGLTLITGAVYFAVMDIRTTRRVVLTALCLSAAIFFWFPYVLFYPAVFLLVWRWSGFRRVVHIALWMGLFLGIAYSLVLAAAHLHNVKDIVAWYQDSKHQLLHPRPSVPRLVFGIARSFLNMGDGGIVLKRFLLHDPYAQVGMFELAGQGLIKTLLFYAAFAALLAAHWSGRGGVILWALLAAFVPVALFAMFLFEASSPERYIGLDPFIGTAAAAVFSRDNTARGWVLNVARRGLLVFAALTAAFNCWAMSRPVIGAEEAATGQRLEDLRRHLHPDSKVALIKYSDEILLFRLNFPFHPLNRDRATEFFDVVDIGSARMFTWRQEFAQRVRTAWEKGADVWISARLWQPRPKPEWLWSEGDDPNIRWTELPEFFSQFDIAERTSGEDGFMLLARSNKNQLRLEEAASLPATQPK